MSKPKMTPWFSSEIKPSRIGEYQYRYHFGYTFNAFWNGKIWLIRDKSKGNSWLWDKPVGSEGKWRGLSSDPSKAKEGE